MNIGKKFWFSVTGGSLVYLLQFLPVINLAILVIVVCVIFVSYSVNAKYITLFVLMIFSSMTPDAVNIYTTKIAFLSVAYILVFILAGFSLARMKNIAGIPRFLGVFFLLLITIIPFSIPNLFGYGLFVLKDMLLIFIVPMCIYYIFKDLSFHEILECFMAICFVKVIVVFFMFITGFQVSYDTNFGIPAAGYVDEIDALLILLILTAPFVQKERPLIRTIILFLLALLGSFLFGVNFLGFGSQIIIMSSFLLMFLIIRRPVLLVISCAIVLGLMNIEFATSELLTYKLDNIFELVANLTPESIHLIPHSPQVRIIELINLFQRDWYFQLFGNGAGGYFSDQHFRFNIYIGEMDFSRWEIENRKFFNPHNFAFGFLKMGYLWALFCGYLMMVARKRKFTGLEALLMNLMIITIFFNFGYAIKTSFLIGIVFALLANTQKSYVTPTVQERVHG